jgi:hypothetical protein
VVHDCIVIEKLEGLMKEDDEYRDEDVVMEDGEEDDLEERME